jgi:polar amino acid transport system substrate-binding protein
MIAFAYLIEPPFNYRDRDGIVTGCDVELARTVLGMIGYHDVEFVEAEFAQLLPGLGEGRWRMTTGLFATEERREIATFSRPIWALRDGLLVAQGNPFGLAGYRTVARMETCTLAVIRDQIQHRHRVRRARRPHLGLRHLR